MTASGDMEVRPGAGPEVRFCAAEGCVEAGEYPAPRSRAALADRIWLCLEHVRAYNAAWDYYAGMSAAEIEAQLRADTTWRRPTWPMGARRGNGRVRFRDPLGILGAPGPPDCGDGASPAFRKPEERRALAAMDLAPPVTASAVKARYKELVKTLHPDANGGDPGAEERLKLVNRAYDTLRAARPV